jgi:hypothetical protein
MINFGGKEFTSNNVPKTLQGEVYEIREAFIISGYSICRQWLKVRLIHLISCKVRKGLIKSASDQRTRLVTVHTARCISGLADSLSNQLGLRERLPKPNFR